MGHGSTRMDTDPSHQHSQPLPASGEEPWMAHGEIRVHPWKAVAHSAVTVRLAHHPASPTDRRTQPMRTTRIRVPLLLLVTLTSGATAATAATAARAQGAEAPARRAAGGGGRDSTAAQRALV